MPNWEEVGRQIAAATGTAFRLRDQRAVGGGCINQAYRLQGDGNVSYFVKVNQATGLEMFTAEAEGLREILASQSVRAPAPICWGTSGGHAFLAMEYLPLGGGTGGRALGERLAAMHRAEADRFGWHRDNTIGSTPQPNAWTPVWVDFLRDQRLGFQLDLAGDARLRRGGDRLLARLDEFFTDYQPRPSLLHGDLWGGNASATQDGEPVIFDPAVYFGDREADLAMTELFGGFGQDFYAAYRSAWPLDPGYASRKTLYNLYHILNHHNLFGGGYAGQAERMIQRLLAELG